MQAPHLPGGELHGGSEDVVFVPGPDEGRRGGHQVGGGEGGQQQRVQRLLRVLGGVLGLVPLVDGGQLGQGERGRHHFGHQLVAEGDVVSAQLGDLIGTENLYEFAVVLDILRGPLFQVIILHGFESSEESVNTGHQGVWIGHGKPGILKLFLMSGKFICR